MENEQRGSLHKINIAIDGPAGAGKSTVARMVAKELSYVYVDTGAMYRAVTWYMIQHNIAAEQTEAVLEAIQRLDIEISPGIDGQKVFVNREEVTERIRSIEINQRVSRFSQIESVRVKLVDMQRKMADRKGVVMDGRDIGTHVLPNAEVKIFLTASVEERAKRRYNEMKEQDQISLEQLMKDIAERDRQDEQREISPLVCAQDAIVLDTTAMSIDEVARKIIAYCRTKTDGAK